MTTRANSGIVPPHLQPTLLLTHYEPTTVKESLKCSQWVAVMKHESDALLKNNTWTLFSPPPHRDPIGCK